MGSESDGEQAPHPRWSARGVRQRVRWMVDTLGSTHVEAAQTHVEVAELKRRLEKIDAEQSRALEALRSITDREPEQRERLHELRRSEAYERAYADTDPLVSIVIPTYDNAAGLREVSLPSALNQTHSAIEVIVVGDGAAPETAEAIESLGDDRIHYFNRSIRGPYPEDPEQRWRVAGGPPFNEAVSRASGAWLAPLDDDDAFLPDHVERLLDHARSTKAELAYGLIRQHRPGGVTDMLGAFPPRWGEFNLQACLYLAGLGEIFPTELSDGVFEDPYDWGMARRMMRAGVRFSMLEEAVLEYYPSRFWAPRWEEEHGTEAPQEAPPASAPEWEYVPDGWEREAKAGWDARAVAEAYRSKWPEFLRSIDGPGPLGVAHETPTGAPMRRDDPIAENIILAFAHAMTTAAGERRSLSVLDWGGATGHYYELARRLTDFEFDWHVRELGAVCEVGAELVPDITFHDTDDCLERDYDFVMASGSLQYTREWQDLLARFASAGKPWVLLHRIAAVETVPSYPALQRAHGYGYDTEYVGWVFHRGELIQAAEELGLELVREYALVDPIPVAGAPENPKHIGLLLRARA